MRPRSPLEKSGLVGVLLCVLPLAGCQKIFSLFESINSKKPFDICDGVDPDPWSWRSAQEGLWGEDPPLVPHFGYSQESRAPKMPDADRYMQELGVASEQSFDDALLICQVEIAPRNGVKPTFYRYKLDTLDLQKQRCDSDWDTLNAPDVLLRFRFRSEYPISLFGPEDHWGFFISIPHIRLARGDELAARLWDRDGFLDAVISDPAKLEYMGDASLKFDGTVPFELKSNFFKMRCNALPSDQALAKAKPWLDALDGSLAAAETFRPDADKWEFGDQNLSEKATSDFGKGNFRYPAGFLGWAHPEIQRRLKRLDGIEAAGKQLRRDLVSQLLRSAPALGGAHRLSEALRDLEITSASCHDSCVAQATVGSELFAALCATVSDTSRVSLAAISPEGEFSEVDIESQIKGAWEACDQGHAQLADNRAKLRLSFAKSTALLWLHAPGAEHALILKMPQQ